MSDREMAFGARFVLRVIVRVVGPAPAGSTRPHRGRD